MKLRPLLLLALLLPPLGTALAQPVAVPVERNDVVFIGSSSIDFWRTLSRDFPANRVVNLGKAGTTYGHLVSRAGEWAATYPAERYVIYSGDNDIAWLSPPEKVARQFRQVAETLRAAIPNVHVFVISVKPNAAPQRRIRAGAVRKANTLIASEAAALGYATYVDIHHPMLNAKGKPRGELFTLDGIHINEKGYHLWRDILTPLLNPLTPRSTFSPKPPHPWTPNLRQAGP